MAYVPEVLVNTISNSEPLLDNPLYIWCVSGAWLSILEKSKNVSGTQYLASSETVKSTYA